jgi:hypothetical protein
MVTPRILADRIAALARLQRSGERDRLRADRDRLLVALYQAPTTAERVAIRRELDAAHKLLLQAGSRP